MAAASSEPSSRDQSSIFAVLPRISVSPTGTRSSGGERSASFVEDRVAHIAQVPVQDLDNPAGAERFGHGGKAPEIREHHRSLPLDPAQAQTVGVGQYLVDDVLRHEACEQIPVPKALERLG